MNQAVFSPLEHFFYLKPVPEKHENHIPFPQSGTNWCSFQIARSIHSDSQKVKDNLREKLKSKNAWEPTQISPMHVT